MALLQQAALQDVPIGSHHSLFGGTERSAASKALDNGGIVLAFGNLDTRLSRRPLQGATLLPRIFDLSWVFARTPVLVLCVLMSLCAETRYTKSRSSFGSWRSNDGHLRTTEYYGRHSASYGRASAGDDPAARRYSHPELQHYTHYGVGIPPGFQIRVRTTLCCIS